MLLEFTHFARAAGGVDAAVFQVAGDGVSVDPLADDLRTLECHRTERSGDLRAITALDHVDVARVAVHNLAAVATRCPPADPCRLQIGRASCRESVCQYP